MNDYQLLKEESAPLSYLTNILNKVTDHHKIRTLFHVLFLYDQFLRNLIKLEFKFALNMGYI
jgi:hypothetical protein